MGRPPSPDATARRERRVGDLRPRRRRRRALQVRDPRPRRQPAAAQEPTRSRSRWSLRRTHASIVAVPGWDGWNDAAWLRTRAAANRREAPISIYEVHLGSWRRGPTVTAISRIDELADQLIPYATRDGLHAPRAAADHGVSVRRLVGLPDDRPVRADEPLRRLRTTFAQVRRSRARGRPRRHRRLGPRPLPDRRVRARRVRRHAPLRARGSAPAGSSPTGGRCVYNFGRREVREFPRRQARSSGCARYHIDGLRVDAVSSMLYLDFEPRSRRVAAQRVRTATRTSPPSRSCDAPTRSSTARSRRIATFAEESSAWPKVSAPTSDGGLGFGYKWNMGWMHDTLAYMARDPICAQARTQARSRSA